MSYGPVHDPQATAIRCCAARAEVTEIDGKLAKLADDMVDTMYDEPGAGLAAPQVGVQKRLFVYDVGDGPEAIVNPQIVESDGEWAYDEGCLSIPGLSFDGAAQPRPPRRVRPRRQRAVDRGRASSRAAASSTSSTTSTASSASSGSTTTSARRPKAIRQMTFAPADAPAPGLPGLSLR